jgi:hypothetical protein
MQINVYINEHVDQNQQMQYVLQQILSMHGYVKQDILIPVDHASKKEQQKQLPQRPLKKK